MRLLLDTHIWLWTLLAPTKLGRRVRGEIARAKNEVWLSPVSAWELLLLAERGRLDLGNDAGKWVADAVSHTPAHEAALTFDVAIRSREVMPSHPDPADRFLVATALVNDLTLVTADERLIDARCCQVLANR